MGAIVHKHKELFALDPFRLVTENVTLENGFTTDTYILKHPGAAAIVPLTAEGSVILVRQYRHALGRFIWEIPAGTLNAEESPLVCAQRELAEETGYRAQHWQKLGVITPVPGYSDEHIHLFLARQLSAADQNLDAEEVLEVHPVDFDDVMKMIAGGEIQDGKTISALFLTREKIASAQNHRPPETISP